MVEWCVERFYDKWVPMPIMKQRPFLKNMKLECQRYSFYTYLRMSKREEWKICAQKLINKMKKNGYFYDIEEFDDYRREPQDWFDDGTCGAPMLFIKKT